MAVVVDVHGSCVSRTCFKFVDSSQILVRNTFSRNNIVSCMMPPVNISFQHGELQVYSSEYSERCMRLALNKQTVPLLLESDSEYLIIDFFDFCQPVAAFWDTTFSTYDYTFYRTSAYQEHQELFKTVDFLNIPICLWYGYVDAYFRAVHKKFHGNIIPIKLQWDLPLKNGHSKGYTTKFALFWRYKIQSIALRVGRLYYRQISSNCS